MGFISFTLGGAVGFISGFVVGVDYGRRHSEPWRDLSTTASEFVVWAKRTINGGPVPPTPPPAEPGPAAAEPAAPPA